MKTRGTRFAAVTAVALVASMTLASCGNKDDETSGGSDGGDSGSSATSVTFLPKNLGNPYFETSDTGGEKAVEEFGGTYAEVGPDAAAPDAQVPFIDTAAQQGVDAMVISANDPTALCDSINAARDAGDEGRHLRLRHQRRLPRPVHQPGDRRGHRQGPGRPHHRADR